MVIFENIVSDLDSSIRKMKRITLFFCLWAFFMPLFSLAQVVTNFNGRNTVQCDGYTGALYSVAIYNNTTHVTVELKPTKKQSRLNYYSSPNTVLDCGSGIEIPIIGFLRNGSVDTSPFNGDWGWNDVKPGETYHYTMVFAGRIPGGVTNFTLRDKGSNTGARGFGFSNYVINNPDPCEHTGLFETSIKAKADEDDDGIVGVYEGYDSNQYKLGVISSGGRYKVVYLGGKTHYSWWHIGDVKATLRETATPGLYKAEYYMRDKSINSNTFIGFSGGSMRVIFDDGDENTYIKMYPTANSSSTSQGKVSEWSGSGFALQNGYVVTNYHVVDGAKSIIVYGVNGSSSGYVADVVATDKTNDLAIVRITDSRFSGFGTIPYAIRNQMVDVGEDVWVLGYPLSQILGNEIKLTNGVVSARSGYQGDVSTYQISAPVQPGNSGGPLFDSNGNIVGIVNAGVPDAENVGYAIKMTYLQNLVDSYSLSSSLPRNNAIASLALKDQVKRVKDFVFFLVCSTTVNNHQSAASHLSHHRESISKPQAVDLGLSVKWADRNVGALTPEEYGLYYAWGELSTKNEYSFENYRFRISGNNKDNVVFSKYNTNIAQGKVDNKQVLERIDDVAYALWGDSWRIPTLGEIEELQTKCSWAFTSREGINGFLITSKINGNSIFLPCAGIWGYTLDQSGIAGNYWSSFLTPDGYPFKPEGASWACGLFFTEKGISRINFALRTYGCSIRPVCDE